MEIDSETQLGLSYDSDKALSDEELEYEDEFEEDPFAISADAKRLEATEHLNPDSYAWRMLRVALVHQCLHKLRQFVTLCSIAENGMQFCVFWLQIYLFRTRATKSAHTRCPPDAYRLASASNRVSRGDRVSSGIFTAYTCE